MRTATHRARAGLLALGALCGTLLISAVAGRSRSEPQSVGREIASISWLEERSMLFQARQVALDISGRGVQWRYPYGRPQPREAVQYASAWLLDYPGSVITRPGQSVLATWGDPKL